MSRCLHVSTPKVVGRSGVVLINFCNDVWTLASGPVAFRWIGSKFDRAGLMVLCPLRQGMVRILHACVRFREDRLSQKKLIRK